MNIQVQREALSTRQVTVSSLAPATEAEMFGIFRRYYRDVSYQRFITDLSGKDEVTLISDYLGRLVGFSTMKLYESSHGGEKISVIYSGDTVIERQFWGTQALSFGWIRNAGRIKRTRGGRLFWFLIVKGHRTYRYLPSFAESFYPDWRKPDASELRGLANQLASAMFQDAYDPAKGVIHFPDRRGALSHQWVDPSGRESMREDVRFFLERNPNFRDGDELVCVCELSPENLKPIARRQFLAGMNP